MQPKSSPILALQPPANAPATFTANILPVRAQAAYPVNASSRYWNSESLVQAADAPASGSLGTGKHEGVGSEDREGGNESVKEVGEVTKSEDKDDAMKVVYFRGRKLLGREVRLGEMGYKGVLVSLTNTFLPQSSNPPDYRPLNEPEEGDEESDKPPVKVLAEVGTVDSVVVWDHEKVPGDDDLFFRGLGEEGLKWRAGMHAF